MFQIKWRLYLLVSVCFLAAACSRPQASSNAPDTASKAPGPAAVSITPNSGSGMHGTFTFVTSDSMGASQLYRTHVQFAPTGQPAALCYVEYFPPDKIYLMNDALNAWLDPITVGTTAKTENSRCSVNAAGSSVSESGERRTVVLDMGFKKPLAGNDTIWLFAEDHAGTMSKRLTGTWMVQ